MRRGGRRHLVRPNRRSPQRTSASELARVALNDYVSAQQGKEEAIAKRMRPYLGLAKPRLENDGDTKAIDGRYIFDERDRQTTYLDRPDRERLMLRTDLANAYVEQGNRRVEFKKDRDAAIAFSELAREAVENFLDAYENDPRKLAEHVRPELEKKPVGTRHPEE